MSAAPPGPTAPGTPGSPDGQRPNSRSPESTPPSPAANPNSEPRAVPQVPDHELLHPIGRGAYGVVWLARNVVGTLRAVKVVYRQDFAEAHPFEREFHGIQKFEPVSRTHEGFVDLLQIGRNDAGGYFYYVMELADPAGNPNPEIRGPNEIRDPNAEGPAERVKVRASAFGLPSDFGPRSSDLYVPRTLRYELRARGRLPVEECVRIGLALTSALEHLHAAGLVHRDIKPSNIIFVQGAPKLADIGLVADVGDAQSIVGTEGYIAPEGPGTPQADLYALGKVFYEMAMGRDRRDFPNLPGDLESLPDRKALMEFNEIVARACARHADGRYHTAGELLADLRRLQVGESIRHRHSVEQAMGRARRLAPAVGLIALLVLALPIIWRRQQTPRAPLTEKASVFVLPFRTGETNPPTSVGDLRGRITDALIDSLALIEGVRVGPRKSGWISTSEVELRSRLRRPPYNFGQVLTGQTRSTGDTVTFTLCLYDAPKDQPGWTQAYSGKASNLIGLERQAVANVAARLGLKVTEAEQRQIDTKLTNNLKARELLERGRAVWSDGNRDAISKAKEDFLRVVELDPWFLDAYSGLISADREFLGIDRRAAEGWPRIKMTAQRMLQIDDTAFDGQYWSAYAKMFYDWDWEGAKADFERLIPLLNHRDRALYYRCLGRTKEAQIEQELMERENPTDVVSRCYHYLSARFAERRYDDCIAEAARSRELYPKNPWPYFFKARAATEKGDYRLALETLQSLRQFNDMPDLIALEGRAHALMGEREKAREGLRQLQQLAGQTYVVPYCKAWVHAALGDKDDALKDLEAAVADRAEQLVDADYGGLRTDPAWDVLQNEAKFHDLLKATGLNVWPK